MGVCVMLALLWIYAIFTLSILWIYAIHSDGDSPVHPAYNPYFLAYFFSQNSVFLSQQISQQCFFSRLISTAERGLRNSKILMKKYLLITSLIGSQNIDVLSFGYFGSQRWTATMAIK
jgi:hypothetical protein